MYESLSCLVEGKFSMSDQAHKLVQIHQSVIGRDKNV